MARMDDLRHSPLFHDVPTEALQEAMQVITERRYYPGQVILEQDAEGEALHLITGGVVRVSRISLGSRERVLGDVYAPGVIGETAVLGGGERSATVRAQTDVTTLMLYRSHFKQILKRHPQVLWNLSSMLVQRVTFLNDELIAFGLNTESALSHVFTSLYRQRVQAGVPDPQVLPLSTQDIMARISSSRETVSRVMRKLETAGLLTYTSAQVTLIDPDGLENIALDDSDSVD